MLRTCLVDHGNCRLNFKNAMTEVQSFSCACALSPPPPPPPPSGRSPLHEAEEKGERPERGGVGTQGTRLSNWRASGSKGWLPQCV